MPIHEFFLGPGITALNPDEVLTELSIPVLQGARSCFLKLGRRKAFTCAIVSAACSVVIENNTIKKAMLALGSVAPTPIRVVSVEEKLRNVKTDDKKRIDAIMSELANHVTPISDIRATAEYRKEMAFVLAKRALSIAVNGKEVTL